MKSIWRRLSGATRSVWRWLLSRPSYQLMTLGDEKLRAEPAERFSRAWLGLAAGSLGWGIASAWLWGGAWKLLGREGTSELIIPSLVTAGALLGWPFRRSAVALVEIVFGKNPTARAVGAAILMVGLVMLFLRLEPDWHRSEYAVPWNLEWIRPGGKMYRVLVLMPLWGAWSMLAVCQFCRPARRTEPPVAAFARGCGPVATAAWMAVALAMTNGYMGYLGLGAQLTISGVTVAAAIAGGLLMCRASGRLSRDGLLAGNLLTQIVFVLVFLAYR